MLKSSNVRKLGKNEGLLLNSKNSSLKPNKKYRVSCRVTGYKGLPHTGYFGVMIWNTNKQEIKRHIKWITDFTGVPKDYEIVFEFPSQAKSAIIGYRINEETPIISDVEIKLQDLSEVKILEADKSEPEQYDDVDKYVVPKVKQLTEEEENILEKKMVWLLGTPRSGSTWFGAQLLMHPHNIIWQEPWIGRHLNLNPFRDVEKTPHYFFSLYHRHNWLPALRKFILARTYSQTLTLEKNVIIKEPNGTMGADVIIETFPNAKIIWLVRDLRDVIDSLIDAHKPGSWSKELSKKPLKGKIARMQAIENYAENISLTQANLWRAFYNHNPDLSYFIKYEDLKKDTFAELRKVYKFLKIDISNKELQGKIDAFDYKKIPDSKKGSGKFYRSASPGRWQENFSGEEQKVIHSYLKDMLIKLGYLV